MLNKKGQTSIFIILIPALFLASLVITFYRPTSNKTVDDRKKSEMMKHRPSYIHFTTEKEVDCVWAKSGYGGGGLSCNWNN